MQIKKLHINGFGLFNEKEISGFKSGITVLYGRNEAGKSTLLDFIRFTLFGYPRSIIERRNPLHGGLHGGKIWLENKKNEPLSIYRRGDKKKFELDYKGVISQDEYIYQQLINHAVSELYNNIFAIGLEELSSIEKLNESGMEDRIFSMGMGLKNINLGAFEASLAANALQYYKKRGTVQILPKLGEEYSATTEKINALKKNLILFNQISEEIIQLEVEISTQEVVKKKTQQRKHYFEQLIKAYPDYISYKTAKNELVEIGEITSLPLHYKTTMIALQDTLKAHQKQLQSIQEELRVINDNITASNWNQSLTDHLDVVEEIKSSLQLYEATLQAINTEKNKLDTDEKEFNKLATAFDKSIAIKIILQLNNTLNIHFEAQTFDTTLQQLIHKEKQLISNKQNLRNELNLSEQKLSACKEKIIHLSIKSEEERKDQSQQIVILDTKFKQALQAPSSSKNQVFVFYLSLLLIIGLVLIFTKSIIGGAIIILVLLLWILTTFVFTRKEASWSIDPIKINEEIVKINTQIQAFNDFRTAKEDILSDIQYKKRQIEQLEEEENEIKENKIRYHDNWTTFLASHQLPKELLPSNIETFILRVNELKTQHQRIEERKNTIAEKKEVIAAFNQKLAVIFDKQQISIHEIKTYIKTVDQNKETHIKCRQWKEALKSKRNKKAQLISEIEAAKTRINDLLKKDNFPSVDAFFTHFEIQEIFIKRQEETIAAKKNIFTICGDKNWEESLKIFQTHDPSSLQIKTADLKTGAQAIEMKLVGMQKSLGEKKSDLKHLLEIDEMHQLQNNKSSLEERILYATKKWVSTQLACSILNTAKETYEKERQPEVIQHTQRYFRNITNGNYQDLRISLSEKQVRLTTKNGTIKKVNELSRGTREQLLLALRLGLIEAYEAQAEPLPIVFDDVMVNFDLKRAKTTANILHDFSQNRQVLYFTCHEYTRDILKDIGAQIIEW